ncbi:MAG TPA: protease modulator HflK [Sedimentisphaerales bacterium]|nr:protease modulator HflK [Sedimentisphaerales bacterium]
MAKKNQENKDTQYPAPPSSAEKGRETQYYTELDAAGKSLSEALRISFIILKIIMVVLVIIFLASGFRTVGPDEQALVLRFGKIRGIGAERLLGPGLHWVFPYPIDKIIKIPVEKTVNLPINSFWYYQTKDEMLGLTPTRTTPIPPNLDPVREGYCITRGEKRTQTLAGSAGSDYNIVHCKWQLTYQINDAEDFFKNVYIEDAKPGQLYFDVMTNSISPLLKAVFDDAVVSTMVNYAIDDAISGRGSISKDVKKILQKKLNNIESGIKVVSVELPDSTWPRQVNAAFQASIDASQQSQKAISVAKGYAETTLNKAAGPLALILFASLSDKTINEHEKELLWSQLAGEAQEEIAQARTYRTKIVEEARADAEYLHKILPEYRKRPKLVLQQIYLDAIKHVFNNADEKIFVQPTKGAKGREVRIIVSRDLMKKPKSQKEK